MIPYSSIGRMLMRSQIEAEMNEEDEEEEQAEKEEREDRNEEDRDKNKKDLVAEQDEQDVIEAEKETAVTEISEEQEKLYECVKGFWRGDGIDYTFMKQKGQYLFFNSESKGDYLTNENFHISYYIVDSLEERDTMIYACVSEESGKKYEIEVSKPEQERRILKLKGENDSEWTPLTCNNCYSFEELLARENYTVCWKDDTYYNPYMVDDTNIEVFSANAKEDKYCLLDVTDYAEGDELIIGNGNDNYTVLGMRDGVVTPFFSYFSFRDMECYDEALKMFWYYYDGGTSGGSYYYGYTYNEEEDHFVGIEEHDITAISERSQPLVLCGFGEDYQLAVLAEEERLAEEAKKEADKTIVLEEMIITESVETYLRSYENEGYTIKIDTLDEENCHFEMSWGETGHAKAMGMRVTEQVPEGTYVYHCGGTVVYEVLQGYDSSYYAFDVYVVLKPDGSIYIENTSNAEFPLPVGTYR